VRGAFHQRLRDGDAGVQVPAGASAGEKDRPLFVHVGIYVPQERGGTQSGDVITRRRSRKSHVCVRRAFSPPIDATVPITERS
jgi:hypothetical protein